LEGAGTTFLGSITRTKIINGYHYILIDFDLLTLYVALHNTS